MSKRRPRTNQGLNNLSSGEPHLGAKGADQSYPSYDEIVYEFRKGTNGVHYMTPNPGEPLVIPYSSFVPCPQCHGSGKVAREDEP